jgi:hypothetical protein
MFRNHEDQHDIQWWRIGPPGFPCIQFRLAGSNIEIDDEEQEYHNSIALEDFDKLVEAVNRAARQKGMTFKDGHWDARR